MQGSFRPACLCDSARISEVTIYSSKHWLFTTIFAAMHPIPRWQWENGTSTGSHLSCKGPISLTGRSSRCPTTITTKKTPISDRSARSAPWITT